MNKQVQGLLAAVLATAAASVLAQATAGGAAGPDRAARVEKAKAALEKRFTDADADHDGRLSRDEAKAGMPHVYEHFDEFDSGKTGSVTLDQVKSGVVKAAAGERQGKRPRATP